MNLKFRAFALLALTTPWIFIAPGALQAAILDCQHCHAEPKDSKVLHAPFASGDCVSCHSPVKGTRHPDQKGAVVLVETGARLCSMCHERFNNARHIHSPVASGNCTKCHNPHSSPNGKLLHKVGAALCLNCHENNFQKKFLHGPVADGNCLICHDPHQSNNPYFLKISTPSLCFSCHDASAMSGRSVHTPVKKGNCTACHDPHGSPFRKHLHKDFPEELYMSFNSDSYALCFDCHDPEMVIDARTETLTNFRDGDRNLHYLHVNRMDKGRSCKTCHDAHAADQAKLIKKKIEGFGSWAIPIKFENFRTGGTCVAGCHKPKSYDRVRASKS